MSNNFITNSKEKISIQKRIHTLTEKSEELKFLVGFFYFSGWEAIYKSLQENSNVTLKILVGLQVDKHLHGIFESDHTESNLSNEEHFARFMQSMGYALNDADMDNEAFYTQIRFFIQMLEEERLIIRKTLNPNHAKLYLFKYDSAQASFDGTAGRFITGSSNLTKAGLKSQEEFNVEIRDYGFEDAESFFDSLWELAVPITEADKGKQVILNFLKNKTQTALITPFEAYGYILKTYLDLQEDKKINSFLDRLLDKAGFTKFSYQADAVNQALNIIEAHNGAIIADVVGLGKSVIASLIANQLGKPGLILCPPGLIGSKTENTGWYEYINKFELTNWDIVSTGRVEDYSEAMAEGHFDYEVVIVDEAHKFRNEDTVAYEALANICRGKQVILLTATPFNNSPVDIFALLKLFLVPGESSITATRDLEWVFKGYDARFKKLSYILKNYNSEKEQNYDKAVHFYTLLFNAEPPIDIDRVKKDVERIAQKIKNTITPVTIRRNRLDLKTDFQYKKEIDKLSEIEDPKELFYELDEQQSNFYDEVISQYFSDNGRFKGAIYQPFLYEGKPSAKKKKDSFEEGRTRTQQQNLYDFMRRLLVRRFESSFGAFQKTLERFLRVNKMVKSFVEQSGKYILDRKLIEGVYNEEEDADGFTEETIRAALDKFKENAADKTSLKHTKIYDVDTFHRKQAFLDDIESDIELFKALLKETEKLQLVKNDPKRKAVAENVKAILARDDKPKRKIIIFSEYTDTVKHLKSEFQKEFMGRALFCAGVISKKFAKTLDENFNAKHPVRKDDFDILITSDKLSEGFNLNRAGLIINYDIPWNPTRVIQRVGRINRIGTKVFDKLMIYNYFPTKQGAGIVKSREIASQKMFLIHNALGEDAKIFDPEEEPTPAALFKKINTGIEADEELSINTVVRNEYNKIKSNYPEVVERINQLPNRTKTAKQHSENNVVVMRRKGMALFSALAKSEGGKIESEEKTFEEIFSCVKCGYEEERLELSPFFWKAYQEIKQEKIRPGTASSEKSIEVQALNSLKSLLKLKKDILDDVQSGFIAMLIKDIKQYKTLPKNTLRHLVVPDRKAESYNKLIKYINALRRQIGSDYLNLVLQRNSGAKEDIIIAVENKETSKN